MKFALIERDAYGAYLVLGPLNDARVTLLRARPGRLVPPAQPAS